MLHFVDGSFPMQVHRTSCDKEIGSPKRGWHVCNRRAIAQKESRFGQGSYLHYCAVHAPVGSEPLVALP